MEYKCKKCGKAFSSKRILGSHIGAHNGAQAYQQKKYAARKAAYHKNPKLCKQCHKPLPYPYKADPRIFCNHSCAATYNNRHKTYGIRRSKLETYTEEKLLVDFPTLDFVFNAVDIINLELDIYIPALRLAIELNGPVHYEPIYGAGKFEKIKNNDAQKFKLCHKKGIELAVINVVQHKDTTKSTEYYYSFIYSLIQKNIARCSQ